uniref:Regulatory protein PupR, putative n=1 Tax=Caulobacter sp. (strain K31) TaxID=366602 RepID=B0SVP1_CAUSK
MDDAPDSVAAQAAAWLARLDTGVADEAEFERWRGADPRHAVAFAKVGALWSDLARAGRTLAEPAPVAAPTPAPSRRRLLEAAGIGAVAILGGGVATRAFARQRVVTGVGQRLDRKLADGAVMTLNTDTEVRWREGRDGVEVWLERGEVSLTTAGRPFLLRAAAETARLQPGGRYNARMRGPVTDVTVLSGQAAASSVAAAAAHNLTLTASGALTRPTAAPELQTIEAWRRGEVVFEDEPLAAAVEEYNRYLTRKLMIVDPQLATVRVGGRFTSSDPADFLQALSASLGVTSRRAGDDVILTRAK